MLAKKTLLSLAQFLELQGHDYLQLLFEKHGIRFSAYFRGVQGASLVALREGLESVSELAVESLLGEIALTLNDLRFRVNPRYRFDERLGDLQRLLALDGYRLDSGAFTRIEPQIEGTPPIRDDLEQELVGSRLSKAHEVQAQVEAAISSFRQEPPDFNGSLTHARIALESLAREIALTRQVRYPGVFDTNKWGSVLSYLRTSALISAEEEKALAGVYSLLSQGAHRTVGLTEAEMARLALSLAFSMLYFLIKQYNSSP